MDGMVHTRARSIHVVKGNKPKRLTGLSPQGTGARYRDYPLPWQGQGVLPAKRAHLTHSCHPCGTWSARLAPAWKGGKPHGQPMAGRVWGWEQAQAALSWDGYGWQHSPTRQRADCPAVSRHENHGGIDREGVAHVGGLVPLVRPSPSGHQLLSSIVPPAGGRTADGSCTRPSRCLSRMKGNGAPRDAVLNP